MYKAFSLICIFLLTACGGGGGGGESTSGGGAGQATPAPTISLSPSSTSVVLNTSVTITWSTTNATSCTASGAWSGSKSTNGSEDVSISVAGDNIFSLSCTGSGGSSSASTTVASYQTFNGIVVDGYIRGSDVFIDTNNNYTKDNSENTTTTDYEGKFTNLKYNNGNLISVGGFDVDTGNLLDRFFLLNKLSSHSDFIVITPITSVATFMTDPSTINSALGIDASIDINTTDPVANLSSGSIYNYLYEKGNQLAVMALSLQNAINVYNTSIDNTKDYFTGIAQVLEQEYTATPDTVVDIESEAFINKVVDNITATKASTIDSAIKTNIKSVLKAVIPVIRVMSSTSTTTVIQNFAFSQLQTDIKAVALGTASTATLTSYASNILRYIATNQGIDPGDLGWVNRLPIITSSANFSANENQTAIGTVTATDADGDPLTYTLTGSDASLITIGSSSGVMTFNTAPDYETKNSYSVTVNVSDGEFDDDQDLTIAIIDVNECPSGTTSSGIFNSRENCILSGTITDNLTLFNPTKVYYEISGAVFIGKDMGADGAASDGISATLTIEEGTTLYGDQQADYLLVNRGSKIEAIGTLSNPIVFTGKTSIEGTADNTSSGLWGGLAILGKGKMNWCKYTSGTRNTPCENNAIGTSKKMGGEINTDNSGTLKYVRIEYAGQTGIDGADIDELAGLTLGAVGNQTTIDYVQVYNSEDDCVRVWGGDVDIKHFICSGADDDGFDINKGYTGRMQFIVASHRKYDSSSQITDNCFNLSVPCTDAKVGWYLMLLQNVLNDENKYYDETLSQFYLTEPRTNPKISNFTFISSRNYQSINLFKGGSGQFKNGILYSYTSDPGSKCLFDGGSEEFVDAASTPKPTFKSTYIDCISGPGLWSSSNQALVKDAVNNNVFNSLWGGTYTNTMSGLVPGGNESGATTTNNEDNDDNFFVNTSYVGAVENELDNWYKNWTVPGSLDFN